VRHHIRDNAAKAEAGMAIVPKKIPDKIQFYQQRVTPWTTNSSQIGVTSAQMTSMSAKVTAAAAALTAHNEAKQASKDATTVLYDAVRAMGDLGAALISQIKGKAQQDGDEVYALASLPVPPTPSPVGAPGAPFGFKVVLNPNGSLELKWKCNNPVNCTNVIYQVYRKVEASGEYMYIGGVGERKFIDFSVPSGVPTVDYQIQATRSTAVGVANTFTVKFGVDAGGAMTATISTSAKGIPAKIAA
jgi:hypothetical protein